LLCSETMQRRAVVLLHSTCRFDVTLHWVRLQQLQRWKRSPGLAKWYDASSFREWARRWADHVDVHRMLSDPLDDGRQVLELFCSRNSKPTAWFIACMLLGSEFRRPMSSGSTLNHCRDGHWQIALWRTWPASERTQCQPRSGAGLFEHAGRLSGGPGTSSTECQRHRRKAERSSSSAGFFLSSTSWLGGCPLWLSTWTRQCYQMCVRGSWEWCQMHTCPLQRTLEPCITTPPCHARVCWLPCATT
jgi:hypothetical protein